MVTWTIRGKSECGPFAAAHCGAFQLRTGSPHHRLILPRSGLCNGSLFLLSRAQKTAISHRSTGCVGQQVKVRRKKPNYYSFTHHFNYRTVIAQKEDKSQYRQNKTLDTRLQTDIPQQ